MTDKPSSAMRREDWRALVASINEVRLRTDVQNKKNLIHREGV